MLAGRRHPFRQPNTTEALDRADSVSGIDRLLSVERLRRYAGDHLDMETILALVGLIASGKLKFGMQKAQRN